MRCRPDKTHSTAARLHEAREQLQAVLAVLAVPAAVAHAGAYARATAGPEPCAAA
ncbi:hypothetical protein [Streptomyces sp. NBC_01363]|uniref:hypothetical protein n=1 Tax=Streptomyces sp. NBC_01363 TaxID=2903840 RepID=UPI00225254EA|nr:hypothetical protein [Streptomyces sp. NBC_01363]MCX4736794.1 hypothetical protein [Streptomyces sp. NBC_01363]